MKAFKKKIKSGKKLASVYGEELLHRKPDANKGTYHKLLILAGSKGMAGAAVMSGLAAYRMGVGMVKYLGAEENRLVLQTALPEAMYESLSADKSDWHAQMMNALSWADAVILGPGLSQSGDALKLLRTFAACFDCSNSLNNHTDEKKEEREKAGFEQTENTAEGCAPTMQAIQPSARQQNPLQQQSSVNGQNPLQQHSSVNGQSALHERSDARGQTLALRFLLLDADALNLIAAYPELKILFHLTNADGSRPEVVITPHVGEMSRLCGKSIAAIKENAVGTAEDYAAENDVTVVLKDATTAIADSAHQLFLILDGSPALAKAGSGDVLTGAIAGAWAVTGASAAESAAMGAWLHGQAGRIAAKRYGENGVLARDTANALPLVLRDRET